jgi:hypothetical protein
MNCFHINWTIGRFNLWQIQKNITLQQGAIPAGRIGNAWNFQGSPSAANAERFTFHIAFVPDVASIRANSWSLSLRKRKKATKVGDSLA